MDLSNLIFVKIRNLDNFSSSPILCEDDVFIISVKKCSGSNFQELTLLHCQGSQAIIQIHAGDKTDFQTFF